MQTNPHTPSAPPVADPPSSESLLKPAEVASILKVAPGTLKWWRRMKKARAPVYVRIGRAVRYRRADIEKFIEVNAQGKRQ